MTAVEALRALRERWWVLVAATVVAAVAAYIYVNLPWVEPRWRSSVLIQATGRLDYGNFLALEKELRPLAEQVRQLGIMREVDRNLHTDLPPELMLERTKAEPVQDSGQIRIDVEDPDARRAEQVSLEIADVYVRQHNAEEQGKLREERVILSTLDRGNQAVLTWPLTRILVPGAALLGLLVATGGRADPGLFRRLDPLGGRYPALPAAAAAGQRASLPAAQRLRPPVRAHVPLRTRRRKVVSERCTRHDLSPPPDQTSTSLAHGLAQWPRAGAVTSGSALAMLAEPRSADRRGLPQPGRQPAVLVHRRQLQTIGVTSAAAGEGKSTTVANLAIALAEGGRRVIVIDADLRRPGLHTPVRTRDHQDGLSNVLLGEQTPAAVAGYAAPGRAPAGQRTSTGQSARGAGVAAVRHVLAWPRPRRTSCWSIPRRPVCWPMRPCWRRAWTACCWSSAPARTQARPGTPRPRPARARQRQLLGVVLTDVKGDDKLYRY